MFEPMSLRSMCGQDRFSSKASAPASWQAFASVCQWAQLLVAARAGHDRGDQHAIGIGLLDRRRSGQPPVERLVGDQLPVPRGMQRRPRPLLHREVRAVGRRRAGTWSSARATLTTGCRPIVLVTTPPQPASKARMMLLSDSVGGADDSRNGFSNRSPVKVTASGLPMTYYNPAFGVTPLLAYRGVSHARSDARCQDHRPDDRQGPAPRRSRRRRPAAAELHRRPLGRVDRDRMARRDQPGAGPGHRQGAALDRPRPGRRRHRRAPGLPGLERDAARRPGASDVRLQGAPGNALRGAGPHRHDRARQDARRGPRQRPPRHRVRRSRLRGARRCSWATAWRTSPPASTAR